MSYYLESKINIICHNLDYEMKNYQLRCALAMLSIIFQYILLIFREIVEVNL